MFEYDEDEEDFIETTEEAIRAALADAENDEARYE